MQQSTLPIVLAFVASDHAFYFAVPVFRAQQQRNDYGILLQGARIPLCCNLSCKPSIRGPKSIRAATESALRQAIDVVHSYR